MPIREGDLVVPALRLMAAQPNGFISTSNLIDALEAHFQPTGNDAAILSGRSDTHFSQKVRNLVSHRNNGRGLETRGLATYLPDREGWQIHDDGRDFVGSADDVD